MHHIYQSEGIVVAGVNSGDSNRKIFLFGREVGMIGAVVQSGRVLRSKLRPSIQDFTIGHYALVRGKNEWKLVGAKSSSNIFFELHSEPEKILVLSQVLSLLKKLLMEGEESREIYDLLREFIEYLPRTSVAELKSLECLVLLRILTKLGVLRPSAKLMPCFEDNRIDAEMLTLVATNRAEAIKLINESLDIAEVARK